MDDVDQLLQYVDNNPGIDIIPAGWNLEKIVEIIHSTQGWRGFAVMRQFIATWFSQLPNDQVRMWKQTQIRTDGPNFTVQYGNTPNKVIITTDDAHGLRLIMMTNNGPHPGVAVFEKGEKNTLVPEVNAIIAQANESQEQAMATMLRAVSAITAMVQKPDQNELEYWHLFPLNEARLIARCLFNIGVPKGPERLFRDRVLDINK